MPRKSAEALSVIPLDGRQSRLRAPASLPPAEARLFAQLVAANAPAHFKTSDLPLLQQYVAAAVLNDQATAELRAGAVVGGRPSPWLAVFEKTNRAVVALSMRLRLSPQARSPNHPPAGSSKTATPSAYDLMRLKDDRCNDDY
jgi:hypothetical protein